MKHKQDERGFHLLGLALLMVAIVAVGLTGWKVTHHNSQKTNNNNGDYPFIASKRSIIGL